MATHWRKLTNPEFLGSYSLVPNEDLILTIQRIEVGKAFNGDKLKECITAFFCEPNYKPMILNKTNCKIISKIYNSNFIEEWGGKKIQIYAKSIKAFGEKTDALRIREFIPNFKTDYLNDYKSLLIDNSRLFSEEEMTKYLKGCEKWSETGLKKAIEEINKIIFTKEENFIPNQQTIFDTGKKKTFEDLKELIEGAHHVFTVKEQTEMLDIYEKSNPDTIDFDYNYVLGMINNREEALLSEEEIKIKSNQLSIPN